MMMRAFVLALCLVTLHTVPSAAGPSKKELVARAAALRDRLDGQGFTVVVETPFVVVGDESPARVRKHAEGILRWSIARYEAQFFKARPSKIIEVWLFKNEKTYRRGAKKHFGDTPSTPYGYYSSEDDAIIMNIGPGAGTLTHEVVHPYVEADFPSAPAWLNEGLASLYERPTDRDGEIWGLPNWRLPGLKRNIRDRELPDLPALLATTSDEFYGADYDSYAYARYLMLYLQEKGKLRDFYARFRRDARTDPTGKKTLAAVLGTDDLVAFGRTFRKWALALEQ